MIATSLQARTASSLTNINNATRKQLYHQEQISTGKRVLHLGDDPTAALQGLRDNRSIAELDRFISNSEYARNHLYSIDSSLQEASTLLISAREKAIAGNTSAYDSQERAALADEVDSIHQSLLRVANSDFGGIYLFGGTATDTPPFNDPPSPNGYVGTDQSRTIQITSTSSINTTLDGNSVFADPHDIFGALQDLSSALRNDDVTALDAIQTDIDNSHKQILRQLSTNGVQSARLDGNINLLTSLNILSTDSLSANLDTDIAEASIELNEAQFVLESSLNIAAQSLSTSLLDFL